MTTCFLKRCWRTTWMRRRLAAAGSSWRHGLAAWLGVRALPRRCAAWTRSTTQRAAQSAWLRCALSRALAQPDGRVRCRCTAAPEEEDDYLLVSDAARPPGQRGLKGLRAALLETREWNSSAARNALAADAEAAGDPIGLAPLLRGKRARHLAKVHLLAMCRAWGYRSFHWCVVCCCSTSRSSISSVLLTHRCGAAAARRKRRGDVKRKRRGARVAETTASAEAQALSSALVVVQRPPGGIALDARDVAALLRERFVPGLAESASALAGPRARAAAHACGAAPFAAEHVRAYDALAASVAALAAAWAHRAAAQARWSGDVVRCTAAPGAIAALLHLNDDSVDAAAAPTWRALPYLTAASLPADDPPVEAMLPVLRTHLGTGLRMWRHYRGARLELVARSSGAASGADAAASLPQEVALLHAEFAHGIHSGLAVEAAASALLAQLRATAPLADYAAAAEQLAALLARYAADAAAALAERAAWARVLVEQEGLPLQPSLPIFRAVPPAWDALAAAQAAAQADCCGGGRPSPQRAVGAARAQSG